MDLFERHDRSSSPGSSRVPLAERMRPQSLTEFVGQQHLIGEGTVLRRALDSGELGSLILWGPPGSGKTTLARLLAGEIEARFVAFSAVTAGVRDIKEVVARARVDVRRGRQTVLFIDEIHRFNKAQQDALLPHTEDGTVVFVGATTENPSFEVVGPLLSRSRVLTLEPLSPEELAVILERALRDGRGLQAMRVVPQEGVVEFLAHAAAGDARVALSALEVAAAATSVDQRNGRRRLTRRTAEEALAHKSLHYDKAGEEHFNLISALHKSLRNSDPDAALYWLGRMLEAGEDPLYVARRLVRFAAEDVGLADPQALVLAVAAKEAVHFVGLPEGNLALAEAAVYLAAAPKSNTLYRAYGDVVRELKEGEQPPVPLHLRNAPTGLMRELGYGRGYRYAHDEPGGIAGLECLPPALRGKRFYRPGARGFEGEVAARLQEWERKRRAAAGGGKSGRKAPGGRPERASPREPLSEEKAG